MMRQAVTALGCLIAVSAVARAQGAVSTQGFGYPAGGLSTRAEAGGGAFAEFDFLSTRNPSGILGWGRGGLYFQYDPEFRSVSAGGKTNNTMTARFPLTAASVQLGPRVIVSLSSSTLLDRTWATRVRGAEILGTDSVAYEERVESNGAINDIRLGGALSITQGLSVGVGVHAYTGENRVHFLRQFDDSLKYGALNRQLTLGYLGKALSVGATWRPNRTLAIAASARGGGSLDMRVSDTVVTSARAPSRYGAGVRFDGIPGVSFGFSADHTSWSNMSSLSVSSSLVARDAWEYDFGAEMTAWRMGPLPALLYLGYRDRDLPFSTTGTVIAERAISTGVSMPISGPRAVLDVALQRASRTSVAGVKEGAWIMSFGVTIRP
jgi:hypothetical protein